MARPSDNRLRTIRENPSTAEAEHRGSATRFPLLIEQLPDAVFLLDPHDPQGAWPIVDCNDLACHMNGYPREELIGQSIDLLNASPGAGAERTAYFEQLRREGMFKIETVHRRKDGTLIPIETSTSLVIIDGRELVLGIDRDITSRQRAEAELRESEERYRRLVELSPDAILVLCHGRFVYVNASTVDLFGAEHAKDLLGRSYLELVHPDYRQFVVGQQRRVAEDNISLDPSEEQILRLDGAVLDVEVTTIPATFAGQPALQLVLRDITSRKQAEEVLNTFNTQLSFRVAELQERTRELTVLNELTDMIQVCATADEAYRVIASNMEQLFPLDSGALMVLKSVGNLIEVVAEWGTPATERVFSRDECWALRRSRSYLVNEQTQRLRCAHMRGAEVSPYLCVPMMARGETLGVLHLDQSSGSVTEAKQRLAETIAGQLGLVLSNLRLQETLRNQSIRDPLTGMYNRRYMEESLEREVRRASRGSYPISILMLDIDHYKQFNDTFGHEAGDVLLRAAGSVMQSRIRAEDIACRYGGEEFIVILPGAGVETATQRAEEIRLAISNLEVEHAGHPLGTVTISIGVAVFPTHAVSATNLIERADAALYRAKAGGRDQAVVAG